MPAPRARHRLRTLVPFSPPTMQRPIHVAFVVLTVSLAACAASVSDDGTSIDDDSYYSEPAMSADFDSGTSATLEPDAFTGATMSVESSINGGINY